MSVIVLVFLVREQCKYNLMPCALCSGSTIVSVVFFNLEVVRFSV